MINNIINMNKAHDEKISFCPASGTAAMLYQHSMTDVFEAIDGMHTIIGIGILGLPSCRQHMSGLLGGTVALMDILSSSTAAPATEATAAVMALVGIVMMITTGSIVPWKPISVSYNRQGAPEQMLSLGAVAAM